MGNYFLRRGTSKEATLFVRIRKRVPKIDKNVNTRIVIARNVWESFRLILERFHKKHPFTWESIDQHTFFDYIKLSSDEIADKIMEKLRQSENVGNEGLF